jgi:hypothetical protein
MNLVLHWDTFFSPWHPYLCTTCSRRNSRQYFWQCAWETVSTMIMDFFTIIYKQKKAERALLTVIAQCKFWISQSRSGGEDVTGEHLMFLPGDYFIIRLPAAWLPAVCFHPTFTSFHTSENRLLQIYRIFANFLIALLAISSCHFLTEDFLPPM